MDDFQNIPWQRIVKTGQQTFLDTDWFVVSWILGRFCNYRCSYCWTHGRGDIVDFYTYDTYTNLVDEIKRQAGERGFKNYHWTLSGGEPTTYKRFNDLVAYIANDPALPQQSMYLTTNLSPSQNFWHRWVDASVPIQTRSITASFHDEFADEAEFIDKCVMLTELGIRMNINQVMALDRFDEQYERCARFFAKGVSVTLKPMTTPDATLIIEGYTPEQMHLMQSAFSQLNTDGTRFYQMALYDDAGTKYLLDHAERFNSFDFRSFTGWNCTAGYQSMVIKKDRIRRSYSCRDQDLGSVEKGFTLFKEIKPCITPNCVTSADTKIPKSKNV